MSRSSNLIILGSLATLTSTLVVSQILLPEQLLVDTAYFLATTLILCAFLPLVAGVIDSPHLRFFSFAVYTFMPVGWALVLVHSAQIQMSLSFWFSLALCGFVGGAICDRGAEMLSLQQMGYAHKPRFDKLRSQEYLTPRAALVATDSGAFRIP